MFTLKKTHGRDFVVLNLTDTHLTDEEWATGHKNRLILERTVDELVRKGSPELITVSGDISFADHPNAERAYEKFASLLESYRIPWAFVWGNHDNQAGAEVAGRHADIMLSHEHCLFEKGDPALGMGNYVIGVEEEGRLVYALYMMDSHDRFDFTDSDGSVKKGWGHLLPSQLDWLRGESERLGGVRSALIMHIPFYTYRDAFEAAWNHDFDPMKVSPAESLDPKYWNEGYKDSRGVKYEGVGSYPVDLGEFDAVNGIGSVEITLVGHEHINDYEISYRGMRLAYSLKTGAGCYWNQALNGGTLLRITDDGGKLENIFVNVDDIVG